MRKIKYPAVTRELDFIANHTEEADDIREGNVNIDPLLKSVSDAVYKRAEEDVSELLEYLKDSMQGSADRLRINNWHWPRAARL
jgi:phage gp29-like protein